MEKLFPSPRSPVPKLGVLCSGRGTDLQSIIDAIHGGFLAAKISIVLTDKPNVGALTRAEEAGIKNICVDRKNFSSRAEFEAELLRHLEGVDLVVLAGFMRILSPEFVRKFPNRIMNIHPSLLPSFPGAHAHRDVLAYGAKISGCTVHFVDEGTDSGPIILQAAVEVREDDTEETLAARVLEQEHKIYPQAIKLFIDGRLKIVGRKVEIGGGKMKIKRALISVSNKIGAVELARKLHKSGVEIISTGGTGKAIRAAGIPVTYVSDLTGFPEIMNGRVKTLNPKIHGGILAVRDNPEHVKQMEENGIEPIDLVVVNLYPFKKTIAKPNVTLADAIENIDIGGPAMIRAAAKNFKFVTVVTNPERYDEIAKLISETGEVPLDVRKNLAAEAFAHTADYDAAITNYLAKV